MKIQVNKGYGWVYVSRAVLDASGDIDPTIHSWAARTGNAGILHILSTKFPEFRFRLAA